MTPVVAVVGAGLTGASWAALFAAHGFEVRLHDRDDAALARGLVRARLAARFLVECGLADPELASAGLMRLMAVPEPRVALAGAGLMQECVAEDLDAKREVFALADRLAPRGALLATSSSGLSITRIQEAARHRERCLAAHPYNPPHLVPLVELAPGAGTDPAALQRAATLYRAAGKKPVVLGRDVPGYVANRLSAALWREAIELVRSGVASVAEVDCAVREGPGLRWAVMGPHLLYDLGGGESGIRGHLAHLGAVKETMLRDLATWTTFPPDTADVLASGLEEETGGREREALAAARDEALAAILLARRSGAV